MEAGNQPVCARSAVAQKTASMKATQPWVPPLLLWRCGLIAMQNARTTVAGTLLPVSEADAAAYGISAVYQLDDGSYRVEGSQKGFQSDVQTAVTLDAEGNVSRCRDPLAGRDGQPRRPVCQPGFTSQYQGAAPFTLAGKSYTVTDPLLVPPMPLRCRRSNPLLRRMPRGTCPGHLSRGRGHPQDVRSRSDPSALNGEPLADS